MISDDELRRFGERERLAPDGVSPLSPHGMRVILRELIREVGISRRARDAVLAWYQFHDVEKMRERKEIREWLHAGTTPPKSAGGYSRSSPSAENRADS